LRRSAGPSLLLFLLAGQCLYSVYVGGDAWERWNGANRFLSSAMPLFFVLLGLAFADGHRFLLGRFPRARRAAIHAALVVVVGLSTIQSNLFSGGWSLASAALIEKPLDTLANGFALVHGLLARSLTTEDATVATVWAGSIPYFSHRRAVDLLGKNDARIAHGPISAAARTSPFYPGHTKWDYAYSIGELRPDIIHQLWSLPEPSSYTSLNVIPEDARAHVDGRYVLVDFDGYRMLVRKDSPKVDWAKVSPYVLAPAESLPSGGGAARP
jgi:hypothetical protein